MTSETAYKIPQELQEVLLDFTVQYLVEQPEDLIGFAVVYFSRLQQRRPMPDGVHSDESMLSDEDYGECVCIHLRKVCLDHSIVKQRGKEGGLC